MFNKILIANRGEIACRVIRSAKKMGIRTVAVFSDIDSDALHVQLADQAVNIGAAPSSESYLLVDAIISAALKTQADAIHPGYGFLSENAQLASACAENSMVFIGPPVSAIKSMGSKSAAKNIMGDANVPLVPGYHDSNQQREVLRKAADDIGYPVLLKAVAGGGGKGMRRVDQGDDFDQALDAAKREAMNGFGDDKMLVEKFITQPRHVEIQIFCDNFGNAVHLFERDCSIQRRHQKVVEEAPAPGMTIELRNQMGQAAIRCAKAINYRGAGTVEFLLDQSGKFYFMEMNTRLQVEHPVTEFITGVDLVEWQLKVAANQPLPLTQDDLKINGHAIEVRIYAEDPNNDFLPATGKISMLKHPIESQHLRVDSGVQSGDEVSIFYDPMLAKLIAWDTDREGARKRLLSALAEFQIGGIKNNVSFLHNIVDTNAFERAELDTGFIEKHHHAIYSADDNPSNSDIQSKYIPHISAYLALINNRQATLPLNNSNDQFSPWTQANGWQLNANCQYRIQFSINDDSYSVVIEQKKIESEITLCLHFDDRQVNIQAELNHDSLTVTVDDIRHNVTVITHPNGYQLFSGIDSLVFSIDQPEFGDDDSHTNHQVVAPMNGRVVSLLAEVGSAVSKGDPLLVMEAMKMEHTIQASSDGTVVEFFYSAGDLVEGNAELLRFEPASS